MMVAPLAGHRQVQLIPPRPLKSPAIGLHRAFQQIQGVQGIERLVVQMGDGHWRNSSHKTKQLRSKLAQDLEKTRVWQSSSPWKGKIPQLWTAQRFTRKEWQPGSRARP